MTNKPIHTAKFSISDDFTYFMDNKKWIRRLSYRIGLEEEMKAKVINALEMLIADLESKPDKIDLLMEKILNKGAEHIYLIDMKLSELDFNQRREIEACFVASIIRYLILKTPAEKRDTSQAREEFRKRLVEESVENSYADFMQNEVGSDIELTCLYRFERAVLIAKTYISGNRNKGLFLSVGSLLEGSDDFTKYITGGHASKETKRRVAMIERLCGIQPRKRIRKLIPQNFPKEVPGPLLQFADVALSLETEDFSALGLIAQSKEDENMLYREYVGKKMATLNSVRIKVYNKDLDSLFDREVELLKKLNQRDCVVQMLGCFEVRNLIIYEHSFHWRISNLVGAETLTIADAWLDIMEAVYFVHSHGVVIRNLQPENIYLIGPVHNLRVKLADFSFAQKADVESIVTLNNQFTQVTESKMGLDEIQASASMPGGEKVRGFFPSKAEKLEIESRLDYALLKDFMFVAPEVFTKQAGFKSDVWSLGLLILFLIKCMISWKEVRHVQEKAEEAEEECEKKMREMLDGLSWMSEMSEDVKREDTVMLGLLKRAITSCLHVSVKQRASLLEVRNNVQLAVNARKAWGDIMLRKREIRHVQCLSSFMKCMKAVGEVSVFDKFQQAERIMYHESQAHGVVESSTLPLPPNKRTHVFLSHSWGVDEKLRNHHDRVVKMNKALRERGLVTWFDAESSAQMSGPVCQALSDTLNSTCCVLVFVTSNYEEKVNSSNDRDNCYFEFNVAAQNQNLANMRIPIVMEEIMLSQQRWRGRLKAEFGHQLYFDLSNSDDERVLEKQYDKIVERVVDLLKERYPEVSFDNYFSGLSERGESKHRNMFLRSNTSTRGNLSSGSSFPSPSVALASMILRSEKTLLNGRFTIISTFLRTADYECHIIHNNTSQRTQILKHIKVKNMQYENELLILRSLSNEVTISEVEDYVEDMYQKYVAVGWLEGGWLLNVLNDYQVAGQPMSEKCLQSVARGLVSAMKYLHGRGIIYRGLNLSRVLAKRVSEDEMMVKLWDFGPAILKDGAMLTSSVGSGYGGYAFPSTAPSAWMHYPEDGEDGYYCMAPELLRNLVYIDHKQKYDEKVDAWSVGMVLYLLVEGKSCFSVGDARSVLDSIERWENGVINSNRAVNTLSFRNDLVSQGTKDVITGLMNLLPNDRLSWTDEVLLRWSGLIKVDFYEPSLVVSSYLHSKVAPTYVRPPISHLNSLLHENAINYMSIDDHGCFPINPSGRLYSEPYQSNATIGIAYSNLPNSRPIKHQSPPMNFISSPRSGSTMPFLRVSSGSSSTSYESDSDNESISSLIDKISLASPSLIPGRIITILEEPVLKKKECYLKYFHYQEALKEDDINKAEMILQELNRFDSDFTSEYEDIKTFHREYQRKFIEFEQVLNEWKVMVVMKNPKLFDEFKKCKIILEGLKKSNISM